MNDIRLNDQKYGLHYFKLGLLIFFGFWFLIAFSTNLINLFNTLNITHEWVYNSGNYLALKKVLLIYHTPTIILNMLFLCDIAIQGISSALFFLAAFFYFKKSISWPLINTAFSISIALWALFVVMEEIFIAYSFEATHIRLLILEIISLLSIHLL